MQYEGKHRDIQLAGLDWQGFQFALPNVDIACAAQSLSRGFEHVLGTVNRYHAPDVGRHNFRQLSGATAEVADNQRRVDEPQHRPQKKLVTEQFPSQPVPATCR